MPGRSVTICSTRSSKAPVKEQNTPQTWSLNSQASWKQSFSTSVLLTYGARKFFVVELCIVGWVAESLPPPTRCLWCFPLPSAVSRPKLSSDTSPGKTGNPEENYCSSVHLGTFHDLQRCLPWWRYYKTVSNSRCGTRIHKEQLKEWFYTVCNREHGFKKKKKQSASTNWSPSTSPKKEEFLAYTWSFSWLLFQHHFTLEYEEQSLWAVYFSKTFSCLF